MGAKSGWGPNGRMAGSSRGLLLSCLAVFMFLTVFTNVTYGAGEEFYNALSLQGFTGLLNTPNAAVTEVGEIAFLYSNQKENQWRDIASREDSYIFSVGLFSFMEMGGRLTDAPPRTRDLAANFKVRASFSPRGYHVPDLAIGMQDVGGGAANLETKYLVATDEWWRFRFSLGYGTGPDRMDGLFGGVELKALDWLYFLGENDTKETNAGVRLVKTGLFGWPVSLQATAKTSLDYRPGNMEFGLGFQLPLGFDRERRVPLRAKKGAGKEKAEERVAAEAADRAAARRMALAGAAGPDGDREDLKLLQEKLAADGFQNVQVGTDAEATLLVVAYENSRYNHNELDGLAVVVDTILDTVGPGYEVLQLVMKKKGIRLLQMSAPLADFRAFRRDPDKYEQITQNLEISRDVRIDKEINFVAGAGNPSWLKSDILLFPAVRTFVATELANVDYLLSLKADYYLNLWRGAVVNARWDFPAAWSDNFDDGQVFSSFREGNRMDRLMLFQALKVAPDLMLNLGAGMAGADSYGTVDELMWTPGRGNHRLTAKAAYASSSDDEIQAPEKKSLLGAYRFYYGPLDLYLEGTAGQFIDNDRGFVVELKRFFGDTAFSVFYKNSVTDDKERVQMGGVQISLPLTPRRDMKPYVLQVRGTEEWSYAQEVKIVTPGNANVVNTQIGNELTPAYNLERVFFNRDRLSEDYIREHLFRMRSH